ncbi:1-deoxy-D-xylulose 5-phosphate reductoisomerase [Actinobacillus pleuropneumoniae]|nr:1-deoxy-D-xylulose 5-phosphate reductoisomerase [Actinobacillus pleuropneumoniae]
MGAKITIDSATMVNKGLEVIEAHWLYGIPYDNISVLLHPESIIHSFVEFRRFQHYRTARQPRHAGSDSICADLSERWSSPAPRLSLAEAGKLHFREMDLERFPCLRLAYECGKMGGTAPTVFNAANEIAVARFLRGEISFLRIEEIIEEVLHGHHNVPEPALETIEENDRFAREIASRL